MNINKYQQAFYILSFICLLLLLAATADASVGLSVSPQKFELVVLPGNSYEAEFRVGNLSDLPLAISTKAVPFGAEELTGSMQFEEIGTDSPSLWFEFEEPEFILEAGERRQINFTISLPSNVPSGGYYVFVYFEPRFPSYVFEQMIGPKAVPVVGVPFLISTTPLLLEAQESANFEVLTFSIPGEERVKGAENFFRAALRPLWQTLSLIGIGKARAQNTEIIISQKPPSSFALRLKNNDIYHIKPAGMLSIYNMFGDKVGESELRGQTILPGKSRDFKISLSEPSAPESKTLFAALGGNSFSLSYRAELNVWALSPVRGQMRPEGGNPLLTFFLLNSIYFWSIALFIFLLFLLLLFFGRKRIKSALKTLIRKNL